MSTYGSPQLALVRGAPRTFGGRLRYAFDGQTVWAPLGDLWRPALVVCAAGFNVRVACEGFDEWFNIEHLRAFVEPHPEFVVRVRCQYVIGYLRDDGAVTSVRDQARIYDSEAEAWEHAKASDNVGSDRGKDWCWVEKLEETP